MRVAFMGRQFEVASTRYRIVLPAMELHKRGVEITKDAPVIVYGKGGFDPAVIAQYPRRIYDVCDDNYDCSWRGKEYKEHTASATAVTCNSEAMRFVVHKKGGRIATIIPDPYEHAEWSPSWGEGLMWFGHWTNLKDLVRTGLKPTVITNPKGKMIGPDTERILESMPVIEWSPEAMDEAYKSHAIVIIPTGRSIAKSANRLIESVMAGKFVVCEPLPAYEEFAEWMWVGDLKDGVAWAESHKKECLDRVRACQDHIRAKYSPSRIGGMWFDLIKAVHG